LMSLWVLNQTCQGCDRYRVFRDVQDMMTRVCYVQGI
jgi:hypothetical protein